MGQMRLCQNLLECHRHMRLFSLVILLAYGGVALQARSGRLIFACSPGNDLYKTVTASGKAYSRYDSPAEAIEHATTGAGVLLLAEGYPGRTLQLEPALWDRAARKRLRVYIEYPAGLPGLEVGTPRTAQWERTVVVSDAFGASLRPLRILGLHKCHFVPVAAEHPDLVLARVAGFDTAVYGVPSKDVFPVLFRHPRGDILVASTKLSQFITARYAPSDAWTPVWNHILMWLSGGRPAPVLHWTPSVRPTYTRDQALAPDAEQAAFRRGVDWFENARMVIAPSWASQLERAATYQDRVAPRPDPTWPTGDGTEGLLEGYNALINADGTQPVRWWIRADCTSEAAMALAFSALSGGPASRARTAAELLNTVYFRSGMPWSSKPDPSNPSYGLIPWNLSLPHFRHPDGFGAYYGDDNARALLGTLAVAGLERTDRWDEVILRAILANFRTSGRLGFRKNRIDEKPLQAAGWRSFFDATNVSYAPHYQAYLWACELWAYQHTRYEPFLKRVKTALGMMMDAYPDRWHWTNGLQQERARMLLPLAWLVRVEDTPEHRAWLRRIATDLIAAQDASGAIREELGLAGHGDYGPPKSNEAYGTNEATLIQQNGDPLADLLYTTNFAFLGLHEAAKATGDHLYQDAEDRLAHFLVRIQVRSETRPELDGAWFRAFEFRRWEYWASNADAGWGAWSVETGWTQAWISSVLAMRNRPVSSLWEIAARPGAGARFEALRQAMLPAATP